MKNQLNEEILARQSWLDCIGQLNQFNNQYFDDFKENSGPKISSPRHLELQEIPQFNPDFTTQTNVQNITSENQSKRTRADVYQESDLSSDKMCSQESQMKQEEQDSKSSQRVDQKQTKSIKQSLYSKSYRQRKKQQFKILQEENNFLKKKINELQFRLREKELQINRLKYPPMEKDLAVEELNEQFLQKTNLLLSKTAIDPINYGKTVYTPSDILYMQFLHSYDQHGFGGRRKKNTLNYFFNEMLQAIMRDSEKYLMMMYNKSKDPSHIKGLQTYELIDTKFVEVMELNEQKIQRMSYFSKHLHPYMLELKDSCGKLYLTFKNVISLIDRVHNFMKKSYLTNMDFARKRIQFQNWVDSQKHSKLMRRLRSEWLQFIKQGAENQSNKKGKREKGSKKNKLSTKDDSANN